MARDGAATVPTGTAGAAPVAGPAEGTALAKAKSKSRRTAESKPARAARLTALPKPEPAGVAARAGGARLPAVAELAAAARALAKPAAFDHSVQPVAIVQLRGARVAATVDGFARGLAAVEPGIIAEP